MSRELFWWTGLLIFGLISAPLGVWGHCVYMKRETSPGSPLVVSAAVAISGIAALVAAFIWAGDIFFPAGVTP